ncbi:MAG: sulfite exporter TauE/SafE family protein [Verrucomicrobia bacterium]|nr:sulfite exporter TauE/SafE family protein [Verrucomicrobiota bacterium]
MHLWIGTLIGGIGGLASGLFGVGGGIIMVPAMVYFMNLPIKSAIGTSLAVIIPTTIVGSFKHFQMGNIQPSAVLAIAPAAVLGGYLGAWLSSQLSDANLKRAFGGFIVLVGLRLLFSK